MQQLQKFNFETETDSVKCMAMAVTYMRTKREGGSSMQAWAFREALPFNDPKSGVAASDKYLGHMQVLANKVIAQQQQLFGYVLTPDDTKALQLQGNSDIANAVKRICNAMKYGGDLKTLQTVNKCASYAADERKKAEEEEMGKRRKEHASLKAEEEGLEPGTDAFNLRVQAILDESMSLIQPGTVLTQTPTALAPIGTDEIGKVVREIEQYARQVSELFSVNDVIQQLKSYEAKLVKRIAEKTASKVGLTSNTIEETKAAA